MQIRACSVKIKSLLCAIFKRVKGPHESGSCNFTGRLQLEHENVERLRGEKSAGLGLHFELDCFFGVVFGLVQRQFRLF